MADSVDVVTLLMKVVDDDSGSAEAIKDLQGIGGAAGIALRDIDALRGAFGGLGDGSAIRETAMAAAAIEREGIAARQAAASLALVSPVLRAMSAAQVTAAADQQRFNAAVAATTLQITGKGLRQEVGAIAVAVRDVGGASNIAGPQLAALGKRLADLERQGAKLPSDLKAIAKEASGLGAAFQDALSRALDPSAIATGIGQGIGQRLASLPLAAVQSGLDAVSAAANAVIGALEAVIDYSARALQAAAEYDAEITKTLALTNANAAQVSQWSEELLKIGPATGKGPTELARALYFVASAGQTGAEGLRIVEESARASAAGMGETEVIAKAVTSAINAYGAENLNAKQALDILTATVREGGAQADEYASSLGRVIPIASQVGVSFAQVGGFLATFTRLGISGAEATTALRGTLTLLMHQSEQSKKALKDLGLSVTDFKKLVAARGLAGGLVELVRVAESQGKGDALSSVIPNVRALAGVLATASAQGKEYVAVAKRIEDSNGTLDRAFAITSESLKFQISALEATAQSVAITFGQALTPAALEVLRALEPLGDAALKIAQDFKTNADAQSTLKLAAGALVIGLRELTAVLAEVISGIGVFLATTGPESISMFFMLGASAAAAGGDFRTASELFKQASAIGSDESRARFASLGLAMQGVGDRLRSASAQMTGLNNGISQASSGAASAAGKLGNALGGVERDEKAAAEAARIHEQALSMLGLTTEKTSKVLAETERIIVGMGGASALAGPQLKAVGDDLLKAAQSGQALGDESRKALDAFLDMRIAQEIAKKTAESMGELHKRAQAATSAYAGLSVTMLSVAKNGELVTRTLTGSAAVTQRVMEIMSGIGAQGGFGAMTSSQLDKVKKDLQDVQPEALKAGAAVDVIGDALRGAREAADSLSGAGMEGARLWSRYPDVLREMELAEHAARNAAEDWASSVQGVVAQIQALGLEGTKLGGMLGSIAGAASAFGRLGKEIAGGVGGLFKKGGLSSLFQDGGKVSAGSILTGISSALGAASSALSVGKAIVGLFTKSPAEKAAKEAGKIFGGKFSKALGEEIVNLSKSLNISIADAALLSFDKAFAASGKSITTFRGQVTDLFGLLARGGAVAAKAIEQIGFAFNEAKKAAEAGDKAARQMMVSMIQQARAAGSVVPEIQDAVREGLDKAFSGLGALIRGVPIVSSADVDSQAVLLMSVFWAKVREDGIVAAGLAFGEIFKAWTDKLNDAGVGMGEATAAMLAPFNEIAGLAADEGLRPLLEGIQGARDVLNGLTDSGYATVGMFGALGQQAQSAFDAMIAQGVSEQTALLAIAPLLADLKSASDLYGVALDGNTQALLDQAAAAGVAFPTDPMLQIVDLLKQLVVLSGGTLPEATRRGAAESAAAFGTMGESGATAAARTAEAWAQAEVSATASAQVFADQGAAAAATVYAAHAQAATDTAIAWGGAVGAIDDGLGAAVNGIQRLGIAGVLAGEKVRGAWQNMPWLNLPDGSLVPPGGEGYVPPPRAGIGDVIQPRPGGSLRVLAEQGEPELAAPVKGFSRQLARDLAAMIGERGAGSGHGLAPVHVHLRVGEREIAQTIVDLDRRQAISPRWTNRATPGR